MSQQVASKIALVTGATRGIGKGIALQLSQSGFKVYITGRSLQGPGLTLEQTANEINQRGGECVPVQVNHEDDKQVEGLFKKIETDERGRLDVLVNNAFKGGKIIFDNLKNDFWETDPVRMWDEINNVGLRNNYLCTVYASRLMVPRKQGLIVNISSLGGQQYAFNAAYGIGKAGVDRISTDCGIELKKFNVACLSLMLNGVKTEDTEKLVQEKGDDVYIKLDPNNPLLNKIKLTDALVDAESTQFAGRVVAALANDKNIMKYTGRIVNAAEYAQRNGIKDIDDRVVPSYRQVNSAMKLVLPKSLHFVTKFVPDFVKVPQFVMNIANSKF